jgi:hypothetical protein
MENDDVVTSWNGSAKVKVAEQRAQEVDDRLRQLGKMWRDKWCLSTREWRKERE